MTKNSKKKIIKKPLRGGQVSVLPTPTEVYVYVNLLVSGTTITIKNITNPLITSVATGIPGTLILNIDRTLTTLKDYTMFGYNGTTQAWTEIPRANIDMGGNSVTLYGTMDKLPVRKGRAAAKQASREITVPTSAIGNILQFNNISDSVFNFVAATSQTNGANVYVQLIFLKAGAALKSDVTQWTPTSIPGLGLWLDATQPGNNTMVPNSLSPMKSWTDKSGQKNHATAPSDAPTYTPGNGKQALYFGGTATMSGALKITNQNYSVFTVTSPDSTATQATSIVSLGSSPNSVNIQYTPSSTIEYTITSIPMWSVNNTLQLTPVTTQTSQHGVRGMAIDNAKNIMYLVETSQGLVFSLNLTTNELSVIAGKMVLNKDPVIRDTTYLGYDGQFRMSNNFSSIFSCALDPDTGFLYINEYNSNIYRTLNTLTGELITFKDVTGINSTSTNPLGSTVINLYGGKCLVTNARNGFIDLTRYTIQPGLPYMSSHTNALAYNYFQNTFAAGANDGIFHEATRAVATLSSSITSDAYGNIYFTDGNLIRMIAAEDPTAIVATHQGSISGTTLTFTAAVAIPMGSPITGTNILPGTFITDGRTTASTTYTVSVSQTVAQTAINIGRTHVLITIAGNNTLGSLVGKYGVPGAQLGPPGTNARLSFPNYIGRTINPGPGVVIISAGDGVATYGRMYLSNSPSALENFVGPNIQLCGPFTRSTTATITALQGLVDPRSTLTTQSGWSLIVDAGNNCIFIANGLNAYGVAGGGDATTNTVPTGAGMGGYRDGPASSSWNEYLIFVKTNVVLFNRPSVLVAHLLPDNTLNYGAFPWYLTDTGNHSIRRQDGNVTDNTGQSLTIGSRWTTIAGAPPPTAVAGFADGEGLTVARFRNPYGLLFWATSLLTAGGIDQCLYVVDSGNNCIRKITPRATGNPNSAGNLPTLPYTSARFIGGVSQTTLTVNSLISGTLQLGMVIDVPSGGSITAFGTGTGGVGTYTVSNSQDPATNPHPVFEITGTISGATLTLQTARDIPIFMNIYPRSSLTPLAYISAKTSNTAYSLSTGLSYPTLTTFVVAYRPCAATRQWPNSLTTWDVSTIAGPAPTDGTTAGPSGPAAAAPQRGSAARFNNPTNLIGSGTTLYVADTGNNAIRRVDLSFTFVGSIAGTTLNVVSVGSNGTIRVGMFITGTGVTANTQIVALGGGTTGGPGTYTVNTTQTVGANTTFTTEVSVSTFVTPGLNGPKGLYITGNDLYIADTGNHIIHKLDLVSLNAGNPASLIFAGGNAGSADGTGTSASFTSPSAISIDKNGTLYILDRAPINNSKLRIMTPSVYPPVITFPPIMTQQPSPYTTTSWTVRTVDLYENGLMKPTAEFIATITGTTMNVRTVTSGVISVGAILSSLTISIAANTEITGQTSGPSGGTGNYTINNTQNQLEATIIASAPLNAYTTTVDSAGNLYFVDGTVVKKITRQRNLTISTSYKLADNSSKTLTTASKLPTTGMEPIYMPTMTSTYSNSTNMSQLMNGAQNITPTVFTGTISSSVLTVTSVISGTLSVGMSINTPKGGTITAITSGTGTIGSYSLSTSQMISTATRMLAFPSAITPTLDSPPINTQLDTYSLASTNFKGYIHEILVYTQTLTTVQRQLVEGYLASKWGITLTRIHPYSIKGPVITGDFAPSPISSIAIVSASTKSITFSWEGGAYATKYLYYVYTGTFSSTNTPIEPDVDNGLQSKSITFYWPSIARGCTFRLRIVATNPVGSAQSSEIPFSLPAPIGTIFTIAGNGIRDPTPTGSALSNLSTSPINNRNSAGYSTYLTSASFRATVDGTRMIVTAMNPPGNQFASGTIKAGMVLQIPDAAMIIPPNPQVVPFNVAGVGGTAGLGSMSRYGGTYDNYRLNIPMNVPTATNFTANMICDTHVTPGPVFSYYSNSRLSVPYSICVSPDGNTIYVHNSQDNRIVKITKIIRPYGTYWETLPWMGGGQGVSFQGYISGATAGTAGTTLTVTSVASGTIVTGIFIHGTNIALDTSITARGTGTGGTGTYTVSVSQLLGSLASPVTFTQVPTAGIEGNTDGTANTLVIPTATNFPPTGGPAATYTPITISAPGTARIRGFAIPGNNILYASSCDMCRSIDGKRIYLLSRNNARDPGNIQIFTGGIEFRLINLETNTVSTFYSTTTLVSPAPALNVSVAFTASQWNYPERCALSPDGTTLYVLDTLNACIRAINPIDPVTYLPTATATVTTILNSTNTQTFFSASSRTFTVSKSGLIYLITDNGRLIRYSPNDGGVAILVLGISTSGNWASKGVAVSPDGDTLYISDMHTSNPPRIVYVPNLKAFNSVTIMNLCGPSLESFSANWEGYMTTNNGYTSFVKDGHPSLMNSVNSDPHAITVSDDGKYLYACFAQSSLIRVITLTQENTLPVYSHTVPGVQFTP